MLIGPFFVLTINFFNRSPKKNKLKIKNKKKSPIKKKTKPSRSFKKNVFLITYDRCRAPGSDHRVLLVASDGTSVLPELDYNGARVNASTNTTGQVKQGPNRRLGP